MRRPLAKPCLLILVSTLSAPLLARDRKAPLAYPLTGDAPAPETGTIVVTGP